jgi:NAD(P) transhydrogenase subunit alpha
MDVLSSQANIAGYKAVMIAADKYQRFFPMLMTAAGTVKAARVVILGVGVAGLQAIATAKRLGAVIEASDVRPSVKEQIESLGGKFIDVLLRDRRGEGGGRRRRRLRPADAAELARPAEDRGRQARRPGRRRHLDRADSRPGRAGARHRGDGEEHEAGLGDRRPRGRQGARRQGRQLPAERRRPDRGRARRDDRRRDQPRGRVGADASSLYARNVLDFLKLVLAKDGTFSVPMEDDIVAACLMTQGGEVKRK